MCYINVNCSLICYVGRVNEGASKGISSLRSLCYSLLKQGKQWLILYEISNLRIQQWIRKWSKGCVQHTGVGNWNWKDSDFLLLTALPSSEAVCHSCYSHSLSKSLHHGIRKLRKLWLQLVTRKIILKWCKYYSRDTIQLLIVKKY